jgi:hypothetical protein
MGENQLTYADCGRADERTRTADLISSSLAFDRRVGTEATSPQPVGFTLDYYDAMTTGISMPCSVATSTIRRMPDLSQSQVVPSHRLLDCQPPRRSARAIPRCLGWQHTACPPRTDVLVGVQGAPGDV